MKKKTIVTFKAITSDRRLVHKNIPIFHEFEEIPSTKFMGVDLPPTTVEEQVINFLDEQDKTELMDKYDFVLILDYYVAKRKERKTKEDEIKEFMDFTNKYIEPYQHLKRPFEAIISEFKDNLFGKRKTNEQKLKEVINIYDMTMKASNGTLEMVIKSLDKTLKLENNKNKIQ